MKKILVIEDEQNIRETLSDQLGIHGYEVIQAADGIEGVQKATNESPDVILCDVNMPGMDGYQVLSELRKTDQLTLVPFIFLTAKSSMEELRAGMELGADDYLTKPYTHDSLMQTIRVAEEKKLALLNQLNTLQNQLNIERLKIRDIERLNSHEIRRKLSLLQSLFPLIKSGEVSLEEGLKILEESGEQIDQAIHRVNTIANVHSETEASGKNGSLGKIGAIWLIDDDATQNLLTKMLLKKTNPDWVIQAFQKPESALEKLPSDPPDLIFLDINMPGMDGFGFMEQASKLGLDPQVVMLSSSISSADILRSLNYPNVVNYVTKPLKKEKLSIILH